MGVFISSWKGKANEDKLAHRYTLYLMWLTASSAVRQSPASICHFNCCFITWSGMVVHGQSCNSCPSATSFLGQDWSLMLRA